MRCLLLRCGAYTLPLIAGLFVSGCGAIEVEPPPPPAIPFIVDSILPANGAQANAVAGVMYNAQATVSTDYSGAQGRVYSPSNISIGFDVKNPMNNGELYTPSMPMQVDYTPYASGSYRSEFSFFNFYGTQAAGAANFTLNIGSPRASSAHGLSSAYNRCLNDDCGVVEIPNDPTWLHRYPLPNKSRQPFLNFTNEPDGSISRADLERRAATWPQATRDNLSAFFSAVYEEDISALAGNTPGYRGSSDLSLRYRAAATALDALEPTASGTRWIDMVEPMITRLGVLPNPLAPVAVKDGEVRSGSLVTMSASPNPATSHTTIRATGAETASVFDILGRRVAHLTLSGGLADWNLRDASGQRVPAGIYVIQIVGSGQRYSRRVTIL